MDLHGHLVVDGTAPDFSGFRVVASFLEVVAPGKAATPATLAPATRLAAVDADGTFVAAVPDAAQRSGPIALRAIRPDGLVAGSAELPAGTRGGDTALKVTLGTPTKVETSGD